MRPPLPLMVGRWHRAGILELGRDTVLRIGRTGKHGNGEAEGEMWKLQHGKLHFWADLSAAPPRIRASGQAVHWSARMLCHHESNGAVSDHGRNQLSEDWETITPVGVLPCSPFWRMGPECVMDITELLMAPHNVGPLKFAF